MRFGKAITIGCGSVIGSAIYLGLIFLAGPICNLEYGELILRPLAYVPTLICGWLAYLYFGHIGEDGMLFIFPAWIIFGAVVGAIAGAIIASFSKH
jgi:hypothetical protein